MRFAVSGLVGGVAAYTVLLTLLASSAGHLWQPRRLLAALRAHRLVPAPSLVAALVAAGEGLVGGVGLVAALGGDGVLAGRALAVAGLLFLGYGGYTWFVRSSGRGGTCGCSGIDVPVTGWVVGRAFVLAVLAVAAAAMPGHPVGGTRFAVLLLAAGSFAVLLWVLPAAMYQGPGHPAGRSAGLAARAAEGVSGAGKGSAR